MRFKTHKNCKPLSWIWFLQLVEAKAGFVLPLRRQIHVYFFNLAKKCKVTEQLCGKFILLNTIKMFAALKCKTILLSQPAEICFKENHKLKLEFFCRWKSNLTLTSRKTLLLKVSNLNSVYLDNNRRHIFIIILIQIVVITKR